jgi:hypothetical protein
MELYFLKQILTINSFAPIGAITGLGETDC